jgi:hypothetical protein
MARTKNKLKDLIKARLASSIEEEVVEKKPRKKKSDIADLSLDTESEIDDSTANYRTALKVFPPSTLEHDIFLGVPFDKLITKFTERGMRVAVAKYPAFYKIYLLKYIEAGLESYPRGGIKVYNATQDQTQSFYYESVAVHPIKRDKYKGHLSEDIQP